MDASFTILDHPSDLGIEAKGQTLARAFESAAVGMVSVIVDPATVQAGEVRHLALTGSDPKQLLFRWLSEVLYLYDGQGFVGKEFIVEELTHSTLRATVRGEKYDESKHTTHLDVKAVTYHQLALEEYPHGATVRVYLDI